MNNYPFSRRDNSLFGQWWWTVDRWSMGCIFIIIGIGILMSFAASPPVAIRLNIGTFFFVKRHLLMIIPTIALIVGISLMNMYQVRRLAVGMYIVGVIMLIATYFYGVEVKGARRWINFAGNSLQASEFIKPAFAVVAAWMFAEKARTPHFPGFTISLGLLGVLATLLLMQPDLGMTFVLVATWVAQLFMAGIPIIWLAFVGAVGATGLVGAYFFLPHVTKRIDQFLDPSSGDPKHDLYQVTQSLEAFMNGGLFGRGPGEGIVKRHVPDAHADFVFAVTGEEFGFVVCFLIVLLFAFFVVRSLLRAMQDSNLFAVLAASGIALQFGLQTFVNMASTLHLIPTKGMTMPFVSYGGSSMIALGIGVGMLLALTKRKHGQWSM